MPDPAHAESARYERTALAEQLVVIIALNWCRGKSTASANDDVTKTGGGERQHEGELGL